MIKYFDKKIIPVHHLNFTPTEISRLKFHSQHVKFLQLCICGTLRNQSTNSTILSVIRFQESVLPELFLYPRAAKIR